MGCKWTWDMNGWDQSMRKIQRLIFSWWCDYACQAYGSNYIGYIDIDEK